jgi:hypothetical protein
MHSTGLPASKPQILVEPWDGFITEAQRNSSFAAVSCETGRECCCRISGKVVQAAFDQGGKVCMSPNVIVDR